MKPPILNINDVAMTPWAGGHRFEAKLGLLGQQLGSRKLGYRLVVLPAGKSAWPFHLHHANEEMFFIVNGSGTLRYGPERYPIRAGDVICCPPETGHGHQIINTSDADLHYLAVSTMEIPEVAEYPDSNKFGVICGSPPGQDPTKRSFSIIAEKTVGVDYWKGEK